MPIPVRGNIDASVGRVGRPRTPQPDITVNDVVCSLSWRTPTQRREVEYRPVMVCADKPRPSNPGRLVERKRLSRRVVALNTERGTCVNSRLEEAGVVTTRGGNEGQLDLFVVPLQGDERIT